MIKNLTYGNKILTTLIPHRINSMSFLNSNLSSLNYINKLNQKYLNLTLHYTINTTKNQIPKNSQKSNKSNSKQPQQSNQKLKIRPSQRQIRQQQRQDRKRLDLPITDPQVFMDHINNRNSIEDAVKLMNRIINNRNFTKKQFQENVWKKYSYYVYIVGQNQQQLWNQSSNSNSSNKLNSPTEIDNQGDNAKTNKYKEQENQQEQEQKPQSLIQTQATNQRPDNHKLAHQSKRRRLDIKFISQITEIHQRFNGQLISQNVIKTFNRFVDFYFQRQQFSLLTFSQRVTLIQSIARYNVKKAKTLFLKKRQSIFDDPKALSKRQSKELGGQQTDDLIKYMTLMTKLEINDTQLFEKCIDLLYDRIEQMNLFKLEQLSNILGRSHKFVNKDFIQRLSKRFNQLINQFKDTEIVRVLHIVSSFSLIEKNMRLTTIHFQPLDIVYERMFPFFNATKLYNYKSKHLATLAIALRRSDYFNESLLRNILQEAIKRQVVEFIEDDSRDMRQGSKAVQKTYHDEFVTISIHHLIQLFFSKANFNYRHPEFMTYFINLLKVVQQSQNPEKYISYSHFSRLLWSICVICNDQEIQSLLPLMQHFFKQAKQVQPHEATSFYYCYLLMKRKYSCSEIRFQNDKIQQYLSGPKHQIQISQTQKEIHQHLLQIGIPSILQYNLNNVICDIYIPKFHEIEHIIIEVHGFHHFARNAKRLNGATVLKEKIIENQGYVCFYVSLDQWLIAEDKEEFMRQFMNVVVKKMYQQKMKKKKLIQSASQVKKIQKRGRRVIQFKKTKPSVRQEISSNKQDILSLEDKDHNQKV